MRGFCEQFYFTNCPYAARPTRTIARSIPAGVAVPSPSQFPSARLSKLFIYLNGLIPFFNNTTNIVFCQCTKDGYTGGRFDTGVYRTPVTKRCNQVIPRSFPATSLKYLFINRCGGIVKMSTCYYCNFRLRLKRLKSTMRTSAMNLYFLSSETTTRLILGDTTD